ncbi:MAG: glycerol-3-phosphate acyltransferase [Acidimicrobiia bacterium]|nr:glycerol-3-phosphate acyltransferase [Acidimicrobiia bacterium]MYC57036.1 glycerol-3-phosphate acyltransferase [Acidimicrobiia bacterium]MYG93543.1 glycerol-3-phosphate acyltransferase [Acidimicrobiia bacterium]MYI31105.1 glycerol-3-phosphate acyltransferase [Acidimicrobiia bacterium]
MAWEWLLIVAGYALGSFPSAVLVGGYTGKDPSKQGSNNPGASNTYRVAGRWPAAWVLLGDVGKGVIASGLGLVLGDHLLGVVCGTAAVVGHILPLGRFRGGGKGVATYGGILLVLTPVVAPVLLGIWGVSLVMTKRAAAASLLATIAVPIAVTVQGWPVSEVGMTIGLTVVVVVRHYENIARMWKRDEPAIM